jgi:hypothetical protein
LAELAGAIESDSQVYDVLQKMAVLGYTTIGNGLDLYIKGELKNINNQ